MASPDAASTEEEDLRDRSTKKVKVDKELDTDMATSQPGDASPSSPPKLKASYKDMVTASETFDCNPDDMVRAVTEELFPDAVEFDEFDENSVEFILDPDGKEIITATENKLPKPIDSEKRIEMRQKEYDMLALMRIHQAKMKNQYLNGGSIVDILGGSSNDSFWDPSYLTSSVPTHPLAPDIATQSNDHQPEVLKDKDSQMEDISPKDKDSQTEDISPKDKPEPI
ncbi:hypothetical protein SESBI_39025 [Sesbania bispinosa]|nr:hypothetical protein SESBI_39025 [Sesbania bispinosa]